MNGKNMHLISGVNKILQMVTISKNSKLLKAKNHTLYQDISKT